MMVMSYARIYVYSNSGRLVDYRMHDFRSANEKLVLDASLSLVYSASLLMRLSIASLTGSNPVASALLHQSRSSILRDSG